MEKENKKSIFELDKSEIKELEKKVKKSAFFKKFDNTFATVLVLEFFWLVVIGFLDSVWENNNFYFGCILFIDTLFFIVRYTKKIELMQKYYDEKVENQKK